MILAKQMQFSPYLFELKHDGTQNDFEVGVAFKLCCPWIIHDEGYNRKYSGTSHEIILEDIDLL